MGKQTNQKGSHFGGEWTIQKLNIIEKYINAYLTALKNQRVKKIYVDGFAGSGITELKTKEDSTTNGMLDNLFGECSSCNDNSATIDGSAMLSLKYDFDEYYFLELDAERIDTLKNNIKKRYPDKYSKVHFISGDSNSTLLSVVKKINVYSRCLMFLDPYALELKWETLEAISKCGVIDLWYLFPLSLIRLMEKTKDIPKCNQNKITSILGTNTWIDELYEKSVEQLDMFGEVQQSFSRVSYDKVLKYILNRFKTIFPYVCPSSKMLYNEAKHAPMFMLCFMMTNPSYKAWGLAGKLAKEIISSTEKI